MLEIFDKNKIILIIIICIIIMIGGIWYIIEYNKESDYIDFENQFENDSKNNIVINEQLDEIVEKIIIDISGQVVSPGVISLDDGSRLIDAIDLAGGVTEKADLSKLNLAYILSDAQKIYIPSVDDKEEGEYVSDGNMDGKIIINESSIGRSKDQGKVSVNINTASQEELEKLPGIGSSIALKIVTYRNENGKFKSVEDLKNVSGIGESKFNSIKNNIYVK